MVRKQRQVSKPGARAQCFSLVPEYVDNYRDVVSCEREYLSQYSGVESSSGWSVEVQHLNVVIPPEWK